jgi:hypothetical protein
MHTRITNHHLPSCVAFVDLIKAYDTANHDLLLRILKKYGAPPKFVASICTMYTNLVVVLKIEKKIRKFYKVLESVMVTTWPRFSFCFLYQRLPKE